jgi:hypothetical protein
MLLLGSVLLIIFVGWHGFKAYILYRKKLILPMSLGLMGLGAANCIIGLGIILARFDFGILVCGMGVSSIVAGLILNDIGMAEDNTVMLDQHAIRIGAAVFIIGALVAGI